MKKLGLFVLMVGLLASITAAEVVGKIRFQIGEVQYRETQNQSYKLTTLGISIHKEGYLKTGPGSSVEVQWNNGSVSKVESNTQIAISKLLADASVSANWNSKLKARIKNLQTQKRSASSEAGIRREEAEVKKESQLFWYQDTIYDLQEAIDYYEQNDFTKAIPVFEGVIQQGPLKKEAELSHAYLILIYEVQGNKLKLKKHIELLKADFPNSTTLDSLPPEQ